MSVLSSALTAFTEKSMAKTEKTTMPMVRFVWEELVDVNKPAKGRAKPSRSIEMAHRRHAIAKAGLLLPHLLVLLSVKIPKMLL
jgi:hypothetical protein